MNYKYVSEFIVQQIQLWNQPALFLVSVFLFAVIILFSLTSIQVLRVARGASQGILKALVDMTPPYIENSFNITLKLPEFLVATECAARLISEGDRNVMTVFLVFARFLEAVIQKILSSNAIIFISLYLCTTIVLWLKPCRSKLPIKPNSEFIKATLVAIKETNFYHEMKNSVELVKRQEKSLDRIEKSLNHVREAVISADRQFEYMFESLSLADSQVPIGLRQVQPPRANSRSRMRSYQQQNFRVVHPRIPQYVPFGRDQSKFNKILQKLKYFTINCGRAFPKFITFLKQVFNF